MDPAILATVLWMCINPTWAGCVIIQEVDYATPDDCAKALAGLRIGVTAADTKQAVAFCRPPRKKESAK